LVLAKLKIKKIQIVVLCANISINLKTKVLRHSHFGPDAWGDGGSKRTAQISEILSNYAVEEEFYQPDITEIYQKKFAALEGLKLLNLHKIQSSLSKTALTQIGFNYYKRQKTMEFYKETHQLLIWESSRQQNYLMSYAAKDMGLKVIGLPHNLESLVAGQKSDFTGKMAPYWFEEELQSLRQCDSIFTISREEQYLLKLFGLKAEFLPYYPPAEISEFLLNIRQRRGSETKEGLVLLLGTAGNKPTFDGMLNRINFFHKNLKNKGLKLIVAGYLTENLATHLPGNDQIILEGTVSNEKLADLMSTCSFCWIHQNISTGSLTKIPELMMAGVPVLLNSDAARNFHNLNGIRVYEHDEDCADLLRSELPIPEKPERPLVHEKILISDIKRLLKN
jgi:hypothetical protein